MSRRYIALFYDEHNYFLASSHRILLWYVIKQGNCSFAHTFNTCIHATLGNIFMMVNISWRPNTPTLMHHLMFLVKPPTHSINDISLSRGSLNFSYTKVPIMICHFLCLSLSSHQHNNGLNMPVSWSWHFTMWKQCQKSIEVHFPSGAYDKEHEGIFGSWIGVQKPKIQASEGLMLLGTKM